MKLKGKPKSDRGPHILIPYTLTYLKIVVILSDKENFLKKILNPFKKYAKHIKKIPIGNSYILDFSREKLMGKKLI